MKKWFLCAILLLLFGCGVTKPSWTNIGKEGRMIEVYSDVVGWWEFADICKRDTISTHMGDWNKLEMYDDKGNKIRQWIYIKESDTTKIYVARTVKDSLLLNIRTVIK